MEIAQLPAIARPAVIGGVRDGIPVEKGVGMTTIFLEENFEMLCKYADMYIAYPDLFIDLESNLKIVSVEISFKKSRKILKTKFF